ncbi:hypothetical protein [Gordonia sp. NPDC003376]
MIPPSGVFTPHAWDHPLHLFAAGSGITPVMSILRSALGEHDGPVTLLYANRDRESTIWHFGTRQTDRCPLARIRTRAAGRCRRRHHRRNR